MGVAVGIILTLKW